MVGWILLIFGVQECVYHQLVSGEDEHSSSKNSVPSGGPQNRTSLPASAGFCLAYLLTLNMKAVCSFEMLGYL
jgi:hypothetical protein